METMLFFFKINFKNISADVFNRKKIVMFFTCIFAKHSICKGLFLSQINICCSCEDVYWPDSRAWMCLHVCGFRIWRLDLEKSGNGRLSCCCWPRESNGEWSGVGGVEWGSFGTQIHLWAARAWRVIREVVGVGGSGWGQLLAPQGLGHSQGCDARSGVRFLAASVNMCAWVSEVWRSCLPSVRNNMSLHQSYKKSSVASVRCHHCGGLWCVRSIGGWIVLIWPLIYIDERMFF